MSRWLMKIEIETQMGIVSTEPHLIIKHPKNLWEAYIENSKMEIINEIPILIGYILFESDTLNDAEINGEKFSKQLIDFLVITTGVLLRIKRRLWLVDWTPRITERIGCKYKQFAVPIDPQFTLDKGLVKTIETLLSTDSDSNLMWALRNFAAAVSEERLEAQFELFWFTIETLVYLSNNKDKVADKCAICKEPLFCQKCNKIPFHRPYPTQLIEKLFQKHFPNKHDRAFTLVSEMRNALFHGEDITELEKRTEVSLSQLVNIVGKVAWKSLMSAILEKLDKPPQLEILVPDTFINYFINIKVPYTFSTPVNREPEFTDIPNLCIEQIANNETKEIKETLLEDNNKK